MLGFRSRVKRRLVRLSSLNLRLGCGSRAQRVSKGSRVLTQGLEFGYWVKSL